MNAGRRLGLGAAAALLCAGCGSASRPSARSPAGAGGPPIQVVQVAQGARFDPSAIYRRDAPGVVTVISTFPGAIAGLPGGGQAAQGSGFVISSGGEIVTNAHVVTNVASAGLQRASAVYVRFADGNEVPAKIVGADPNADVALLRVGSAGIALRPLALGSSSHLVVGSPVGTLGTPFGEQGSLSVGVISATNRAIPSLNGTGTRAPFATLGAIQTDAAINHGNSGGPLVDGAGAVIGINSQIAPQSGGGSSGVGFAVPVDAVKHSLAELRAHGTVTYGYLGVSSATVFPQLAQRLGLKVNHGALLGLVTGGGPAARAGLRGAQRQIQFDAEPYRVGGDLIAKLNGRDLNMAFDLADAVSALRPGQVVTLEVWRGASRREVKVTLGTRPGPRG